MPGGNTVTGIEVRLDRLGGSHFLATTRRMCVQLSWDGGATWTTAKQTNNLGASHADVHPGRKRRHLGPHLDAFPTVRRQFPVRSPTSPTTLRGTSILDWAAVRVYHVRSGGPCQYAAEMGDAAKAARIEVFTIGYGVGSGDPCSADVGAWAHSDAVDVLSYIATDADHFFNQPTTSNCGRSSRSLGRS